MRSKLQNQAGTSEAPRTAQAAPRRAATVRERFPASGADRSLTVAARIEARSAEPLPYGRGSWRGSAGGRGGAARGFTIIELLVTVTLMLLLIFLINRLFRDTADAIGQGVGMSNILNTARTVGEQLEEDGQQMVGPREGGFMVLLINNVDSLIVEDAANTERTRTVADDAILFVRYRGNAESITPGTSNAYAGDTVAPYSIVWLGHGKRTRANGLAPASDNLGSTSPASMNLFANEWIMVRRALMLDGRSALGFASPSPRYDSLVTGYSGIPLPDTQAFRALSDLCRQPLNAITGVGGLLDGFAPAPGGSSGYRSAAYPLTFGVQRLLVNPTPDGLEPWQIAMMHPYLAGNVSDIEIHFAADVDSSGAMDVDGAGNIVWYGRGDVLTGYAPYDDSPGLAHASTAFVWRHDEPGDWPYLIRIRYQLHDPQKRGTGRWFEQIIAVPRER